MKKISSDRDLTVAILSELLWVERRLAFDVLPDMIKSAHDAELKALFEEHHEQTKAHVERVEQAFKQLDMEPSSGLSPGFNGLIEQHDTITKKIVDPVLADRWHAAAGVAAEHFELALYSAVEALADDAVRSALAANEKDEARALQKLERWLGR